jgi:CelD/BcsL family acetyltransferase involved in cellulose biosynthesis
MLSATEAIQLPHPIAPSITVERVDDVWGFTALRPQWNTLLRSSAADSPFLTWEWMHTWWKHLGAGADLRLIVVRADQEPIAVAPLRIARGAVAWFSRFQFLGTGDAGADYLDLIVRRGREQEGVRAIARYLRAQGSAVRFDRLPQSSCAAHVAAQLSADGWTMSTAPNGVCPVIPLAGHTWDSYLATLGSAHRANVRRRIRALGQRFDMRFEQVTTEGERRAACAALVAFHARRFDDRRGSTAFQTEPLRAFHDEVTRRALDRGWLRLHVLRLNGAIAAVMYGFAYNRRFYFYQHGFDEQYQQYSLGLALMGLTVRAAIEEGTDEFDMLWGTEPYKALWARETRPLHQIHLFPTHLSGRIHRRTIQARRQLGRLARRVLATGEASAT